MTPTELKALQDHTDALNRTRDTELQRIAAIEAQTEALRAYLATMESFTADQRGERKPHRYTEATVWLNAYCAAIQARRPETMPETADNAVKRFKTRYPVEG